MTTNQPASSASVSDYLKLHLIVLIWGFTGVIGNMTSIPSLDLVFYRTLVAAVGLFIVLKLSKAKASSDLQTKLILLGVGFLVGLHWTLFFAAVKVGTTSVGMIGLSTTTLWTALLKPLFSKERISKLEVGLSIFVVSGLIYVLNADHGYFLSLFLSVMAGLVAAIFSNFNGLLSKKVHHHVIAFYEVLGAFLACSIALCFAKYLIPNRDFYLSSPTSTDWVFLVFLGLVCTVYPYAQSVELLKRMSVFSANLAVNLEPIYAMILAAIVLQEHRKLTFDFYIGSAIVVISVFSYPIIGRYLKNYQAREK